VVDEYATATVPLGRELVVIAKPEPIVIERIFDAVCVGDELSVTVTVTL